MFDFSPENEDPSQEMKVLLEEMSTLILLLNRNLQDIHDRLRTLASLPAAQDGVYVSPKLCLKEYVARTN